MLRVIRLAYLTLFALVALSLFVNAAQPQGEGAIAKFREVQTHSSSLGTFPGATSSWHTVVLLDRQAKRVGDGAFACVHIQIGSSLRLCNGVYRFPNGQLDVTGLVSGRERYQLDVTGGSGVYAGRHGTAAVTQIASHPWTAFLTFYLT